MATSSSEIRSGDADRRSRLCRTAGVALAVALVSVGVARAQSLEELRNLSIDDLANIEITSVSKRPEALSQAPSAIFVITADDIRRSGAASLPEALRLAPNLEVARINSQDYTISARGFNSANAADKLLVLIDGRSIYSPFFHNVNWNQNEVMLDDVDRIEVISGPGGTLWGANAVNGVINIITKSSQETQGGLVDLKYGSFDQSGAGRWGGKAGDNATYRAYAQGFGRGQTKIAATGANGLDGWNGRQAGFRSDWKGRADGLTVQGDMYENQFDSGGRSNGGNLLGRWTRQLNAGSTLELQTYYDRADESPSVGIHDNVNTFDLQLQHVFPLGARQEIVWGAGQRVWSDRFVPVNGAAIVPGNETLALTNVFAQDTISLLASLKLTIGMKLEYNTLSGLEPMPNLRLAWQVDPSNLLWTAVSRAAETPSRLDRNLVIAPIFGPSPSFRSEHVIAYEAGYRTQPTAKTTLSVSLFYNQYSDLRTTSLSGGTPLFIFENDLEGDTYGAELWGDVKLASWWRLSPGVEIFRKSLHLKTGGSDFAGIQTAAGIDPGHQFFLRSYLDLPHDLEFYLALRQVGSLQLAEIPAYFEADASLGWHVTPALEIAITGQNLVHASHVEATNGFGVNYRIPRSVLGSLRRSF
ncbi:MAG: TonB-dependent receptor, plug [Rhodospirillales bacterium]|nr:TonB-dependent receptor, plug [Rhodospirillales bacterium]